MAEASTSSERPSVYAEQLKNWRGILLARELAEFLSDQSDVVESLSEHLPGVSARLHHISDLLGELSRIPPHTVPLQFVQPLETSLESLLAHLRASEADPTTNAGNVQTYSDQLLGQMIPLQAVFTDRDAAETIARVRSDAQSVIHGVRTSAGRTNAKFDEIAAELRNSHEEVAQELQTQWEQFRQSLAAETAEMRTRAEGSVSEARTNAEAQLTAMRNEVAQIKQRADEAYRTTQQAFEDDRAAINTARQELERQHQESIRMWIEGVQEARDQISENVEGLRSQLQDAVTWAQEVKGDIQIAALAAGFRQTERRYRNRSRWALGIAAFSGIVTVIFSWALFSELWDVPTSAGNAEIVRHVGLRIAAISLPLFFALFAARIYRTYSHLEAVNGERAQAATAFEGFAQRASNDQARDAMLVVLAQLVFSGRDTGHHADEQIASPFNPAEVTKLIRGG
ncbi:MAG: hypothetical protein ACRDKA_06320 [Actinomycetota bacterium]